MPRQVVGPLRQRQLKTVMLRVPTSAWAQVSTGRVREFRAATGNSPYLLHIPMPTLAVVYRRRLSVQAYDYRLVVLEAIRREALGSITEAGLAAAGYVGADARARFRRDWVIAEKRRFEPLRTVLVYTVRPIGDDGDMRDAGAALLDHLYGDYLTEGAQAQPRTVQVNGSV